MLDLLLCAAAALYIVAALALAVFVASFGVLLTIYALKRHDAPQVPPVPDRDLLSVTVQLPVYNEALVIERLIDACAQLDYPAGKLHIQVIDDSTDDTTARAARRIAFWRARGHTNITLLRRPQRSGYKAGALAYGLARAQTDCVAVFDADFIPPRDFLRRTMPYLTAQPRVALVQTRWDHLNADYNLLTRAQVLTIDSHFAIEQVARSRGRLPMAMNGTGGVWRVEALKDAGGWSPATVTEDLDLSYRALVRGWEFVYLVDVAVPGEVTPQVQAYKRQQARWATGFTESLLRNGPALLRAKHIGPLKKFMGLMHLSSYAVQPVMLLLFLLTPLLLWGDMFARLPDLRLTGAVGVIPPLMIAWGQAALHPDWPRRLLYMPVQGLVGAAIIVNNTLGVLAGIHPAHVEREFKRTPKFDLSKRGQSWHDSVYALRIDGVTWGEIALGGYALAGLYLAATTLPVFVPYMATQAIAFITFALWNIAQTFPTTRALEKSPPQQDVL